MNEYQVRSQHHLLRFQVQHKKYNRLSIARLLVVFGFAVAFYFFVTSGSIAWLAFFLALLIFFLALVKIHQSTDWKRQLEQTLTKINEGEFDCLSGKPIPFADGTEFINTSHAYSYDLDFFGAHSLFHHLNRTATHMGKNKLAAWLLSLFDGRQIHRNQEAIRNLAPAVEFRQKMQALGMLGKDSKEQFEKLNQWIGAKRKKMNPLLLLLSYVLPASFFGCLIYSFITGNKDFIKVASGIFFLNLVCFSIIVKKIKEELKEAGKIHKSIRQYGLMMAEIEKQVFDSPVLKELQQNLQSQSGSASKPLAELSRLFAGMDSLYSPMGTMVMNGIFLYHIHILKKLWTWKIQFGDHLYSWLDTIGEFEAISSVANFSFNNPGFAFPIIHSHKKIEFTSLGHPLISTHKRVCSSVSFEKESFIILTGSNMSGKSTFLRALGINMVLGGIGAPVCASSAEIHPLPVWVSMRQSDSLFESESYFFAEVRRLKEIMNALDQGPCLVILDEILRGTNSDDKRNGTIAVIKQIVEKGGIGVLATHDLEVCQTTASYPDILTNKCFEVEIRNDELFFDYKLREGICKNKSATFLMKKMGII